MKNLSLTILLTLNLSVFNSLVSQEAYQAKLIGHWEQEGYGRVVNVDSNGIQVFDLCKVSCEPSFELSWKESKSEADFVDITETSFTMLMGINRYHFNRIDQMPELCTHPDPKLVNDPMHNFESLWQTFNEQYCYFETRNVDWEAIRKKYITRLTPEATDLELYIVLKEMTDELNDGHVGLYATDEISQAYAEYKASQKVKTSDKKKKKYSVDIDKTLEALRKHYVNQLKSYNISLAHWGWINDEVSYVQLNGMVGWADYDISTLKSERKFEKRYDKAQSESATPSLDEVKGAYKAMTKIVDDIKDSKAVILDLRFNGGGHDEVALELLRFFAKEPKDVFVKKAITESGFTIPNVIRIEPAKNFYEGKVFILTSHFTASAAEIFMMSSMQAIPNAVRIGSNTEGVFSDILEKTLPNGWEYGLSNEVYLSTDGDDYESKGIPPHHEIEYDERLFWFIYNFKDLTNGDTAIEKVLELINEN